MIELAQSARGETRRDGLPTALERPARRHRPCQTDEVARQCRQENSARKRGQWEALNHTADFDALDDFASDKPARAGVSTMGWCPHARHRAASWKTWRSAPPPSDENLRQTAMRKAFCHEKSGAVAEP